MTISKSEHLNDLAAALVAFQAEVRNPKRDAANPFFKSRYATLDSILADVRPLLSKHGLGLMQFPTEDGMLTTLLLHTSGQHIQSTFAINPKSAAPQDFGSGLTYMRRYSVSSILGIASEDDDDAGEPPPVRGKEESVAKAGAIIDNGKQPPAKPAPDPLRQRVDRATAALAAATTIQRIEQLQVPAEKLLAELVKARRTDLRAELDKALSDARQRLTPIDDDPFFDMPMPEAA